MALVCLCRGNFYWPPHTTILFCSIFLDKIVLDTLKSRYHRSAPLGMERNIEYIQLFMEYESDDMPMVYFYEVDVNDDRFALRAIEIFVDRTVKFYNDLYCDVVEVCPIPTVDELNEKVWGEGFYATIISKGKFDEIWNTGIYNESLTAT